MNKGVKPQGSGILFSLVRHEFIKIFRRPTAIISLLVGVLAIVGLLAAFVSGATWSQIISGTEETENLTGRAAILAKQKDLAPLKGPLTEERIGKILETTQAAYADPAYQTADGSINNFAWTKYIQPNNEINLFVSRVFTVPGAIYSVNNYRNVNPKDAYNFYEKRENQLNTALSEAGYEGNVVDFFLQKDAGVKVPIQYSYSDGWQNLIAVMPTLGAVICFLIAVCVAPSYASEKQSKTSAVLLAAKYGKTKLNLAKILATVSFATLAFALLMGFATAIFLAMYSPEGWDSGWQTVSILSHQPHSILEIYLLTILLAYLWCMLSTAITLFFSSVMHSAFPVIIVSAVLTFSPMFISSGNNNGFFSRLTAFLPSKIMDAEFTFGYTAYNIFGKYFPLPTIAGIATGLMSLVFLFCTYKHFKASQIT